MVLAVGGNASIAEISGAAVSQLTELWWHFSAGVTLPSVSPPFCFQGNLSAAPAEEPTVRGTSLHAAAPALLAASSRELCLLVQSKAASLSASKAEGSRRAPSPPAVLRQLWR